MTGVHVPEAIMAARPVVRVFALVLAGAAFVILLLQVVASLRK